MSSLTRYAHDFTYTFCQVLLTNAYIALRLLTITDPHIKVAIILNMLYPQAWLTEKALDDAESRTNMEVQTKVSTEMVQTLARGECDLDGGT